MKKLLALLLITTSFNAKSQNSDVQLLQEFINSSDVSWFLQNSQFATNGQVSLSESFVYHQTSLELGVISENPVDVPVLRSEEHTSELQSQ